MHVRLVSRMSKPTQHSGKNANSSRMNTTTPAVLVVVFTAGGLVVRQ
jgi:hypothetical protein